jgi:hypothetical protein
MNPGGLVLVVGGGVLAWWGYNKAANSTVGQIVTLPGRIGPDIVSAVHPKPVQVGGPAPHDPAGRETIGGKTYHPVKNAKGQWVWELLHPPAPHKAPRKVAKTPPKAQHAPATKPKKSEPKKPVRAKAPGTGLVAL